jgi:hypothetical protein
MALPFESNTNLSTSISSNIYCLANSFDSTNRLISNELILSNIFLLSLSLLFLILEFELRICI